MQIRLTEEFYRKRSFTHRYDHLLNADWVLVRATNPFTVENNFYTIQYQDIVEEVTRDEFIVVPQGNYDIS